MIYKDRPSTFGMQVQEMDQDEHGTLLEEFLREKEL
jgi:hypothetical protein